jgi:hypothetical protein
LVGTWVVGMIGSRYRELVERQLDVFVSDEHELLRASEAAERAYGRAGRDEAEESFGDLAELLDDVAERLYDMREAYARSLDQREADRYRSRFDRAATRRLPRAADAYRVIASDVDLD